MGDLARAVLKRSSGACAWAQLRRWAILPVQSSTAARVPALGPVSKTPGALSSDARCFRRDVTSAAAPNPTLGPGLQPNCEAGSPEPTCSGMRGRVRSVSGNMRSGKRGTRCRTSRRWGVRAVLLLIIIIISISIYIYIYITSSLLLALMVSFFSPWRLAGPLATVSISWSLPSQQN